MKLVECHSLQLFQEIIRHNTTKSVSSVLSTIPTSRQNKARLDEMLSDRTISSDLVRRCGMAFSQMVLSLHATVA